MSGRHRILWRSAGVVALLICATVLLTAPSSAGDASRKPLVVLQMNLCDSGIATCYTGRSVTEAAAVIRAAAPDVVTLNEVCEDDVAALDRALAEIHHGGPVVSAFKAAEDRRTGGAFRCLNGEPYGIGLLAHVPTASRGHVTYSGIYPRQDPNDPEERVWLCVDAKTDLYVCATHLASTSPAIALTQCEYLLNTAIPAMRSEGGNKPTVLGGDFNLTYGGWPDVRSCLPRGYLRAGDGAVQQIVATTDFEVRSSRSINMEGTTDHPSLLAAFTF